MESDSAVGPARPGLFGTLLAFAVFGGAVVIVKISVLITEIVFATIRVVRPRRAQPPRD